MTYIDLSGKEQMILEEIVSSSSDARQVLRAYALLWLDEGYSVDEVAQQLQVSRQSIYNWATRFQQRSEVEIINRLADASRSGRPCTAKGIIDSLINEIIDRDPRQLGYRSTVWTAPLLVSHLRHQHQIDVSTDSVSRAIARLRIRWKRPRHHLAMRSPTWRQAKGG